MESTRCNQRRQRRDKRQGRCDTRAVCACVGLLPRTRASAVQSVGLEPPRRRPRAWHLLELGNPDSGAANVSGRPSRPGQSPSHAMNKNESHATANETVVAMSGDETPDETPDVAFFRSVLLTLAVICEALVPVGVWLLVTKPSYRRRRPEARRDRGRGDAVAATRQEHVAAAAATRGRDADRSLMNYDADGPRRRRCFAGTLVRSRPPRRGCCSSEHACCTSSSPRRPRAPAAATCCLKLCGSRVGSRRRRDSWAETALSRYYVPQGRSMSRPRRQRDHVH